MRLPRLHYAFLGVFFFLVLAARAQNTNLAVLPLPDDARSSGTEFNSTGETDLTRVLVGIAVPQKGAITAVAPVTSDLRADGSLGPGQNGGWRGPYPGTFQPLEKGGCVVGGFRFLLVEGPETVWVAQLQVFWRSWVNGKPGDFVGESQVYGQKAGTKDLVKIVELRIPEGTWPTGLYGLLEGKRLTQFSLTVRRPAQEVTQPAETTKKVEAGPQEPVVKGPKAPSEPQLFTAGTQ